MVPANDACHVSDTLTVMNDDIVVDVAPSDDARDVSEVR
jgi:hypothetical protein